MERVRDEVRMRNHNNSRVTTKEKETILGREGTLNKLQETIHLGEVHITSQWVEVVRDRMSREKIIQRNK